MTISLSRRLELLATLVHCGAEPISIDLNQQSIVALGFDQIVDNKLRALLTELILQTVWNQWTTAPASDHPLILVLDECQNLPWGEESMAVRILREGRKFGIGGWFASQWISNKTAIAALGQAALRANFRPEDVNIPALAKQLAQTNGTSAQWQGLFRRLKVDSFCTPAETGKRSWSTYQPGTDLTAVRVIPAQVDCILSKGRRYVHESHTSPHDRKRARTFAASDRHPP